MAEDKENIPKATPTPRKKSAAEKPVVNFRIMEQERKEYIDREWARWEQFLLTQVSRFPLEGKKMTA